MKRSYFKFLISALFVLILFIKGDAKKLAIFNPPIAVSSEIKDTVVYVFVDSIKKDINGVLLFVDFIQFYTDEEALEKAKERGDADTLYENGKMDIIMTEDYYIVNDSKKIRKFYLSSKVKYNLLLDLDRQSPIFKNSLDSFIKIYKHGLFILHISGNKIIMIKEVFLP